VGRTLLSAGFVLGLYALKLIRIFCTSKSDRTTRHSARHGISAAPQTLCYPELIMRMQQFMASRFRRPSRWFRSLVFGRFRNRINRKIIESNIALRELNPQHQVLEIGFGGGSSLSRIAPDGARRRGFRSRFFPRNGPASRVSLPSTSGGGPHPGTTRKHLPTPILRCQFRSRPPTKTIYFGPDLLQGFAELNRVLKPAGRAALSIRSREKMQAISVTKYGFARFSPEDVGSLMRQGGSHDIPVDHQDRDKVYSSSEPPDA